MIRSSEDLPDPLAAEDADLGSRQEVQRDVGEDLLVRRMDPGDLVHGEDVVSHCRQVSDRSRLLRCLLTGMEVDLNFYIQSIVAVIVITDPVTRGIFFRQLTAAEPERRVEYRPADNDRCRDHPFRSGAGRPGAA